MILAVGPFSALPPTMGVTAITGAPLARIASRMPGTARIGSMLSQGFDGQMMTPARSGADSACIACGVIRAAGRAVVANAADNRPALIAHEVLLKRKRACIRLHDRANRIVGHGQNARGDAELPDQMRRDAGQRLAGPEAMGAVDMGREIAVAEVEPRRSAQGRHGLHEAPRLVAPAPSGLRIDDAAKRIERGIDVGRDGEAQMLEIVAGVDDNGQPIAQQMREPKRQLGAADAA